MHVMRNSNGKGFSLIELIVALAVVGILAVIAIPAYRNWITSTQYKAAARQVASLLRQARSEAVNRNRECEAVFNLGTNQYSLARGNLPSGSTSFADMVVTATSFSGGVDIRGNSDCSVNTGEKKLQFNPNGSSSTGYICVVDNAGTRKFRVGVTVANTGRVVIQQWNPGSGSWE